MTNSAANAGKAKKEKLGKKGTFSWALWDWAEQPFPTIMQTFIFPIFITSALFGAEADTSRGLGIASAVAGISVALIAPVLGRRADELGKRKFWLMVNSYLLIAIMAAAYFVQPSPEFFIFGLILYGLGGVVQESAFINYYAMLKQVSAPSTIGRISGYAWGLGYLGGIVLLLLSLVGFIQTENPWFGVGTENSENIRVVFLLSALWMLIFSIPLFRNVPEIPAKPGLKKESIAQSYGKLWQQIKSLHKQAPETLKFLISSAIYRDGLSGVFSFGGVLGALAFGFELEDTILFGIAANVVAGIGAGIGGWIDDRIGSRTTIIISLTGLILAGASVFVFASFGPITYWIGGLALTLFVGPAQAASRTFVARFTPDGREGEAFGLYQTTGRAVSFLSPMLWTGSITLALVLGANPEGSAIYGVLGLLLVLVVGLLLLLRVDPNPKVKYSN
jgi:MFS transporter, UMF1 family